jgi:hypothetical protein
MYQMQERVVNGTTVLVRVYAEPIQPTKLKSRWLKCALAKRPVAATNSLYNPERGALPPLQFDRGQPVQV